jgi:glycosyltransferase involved in cell wall biosynthesis
MKLIIQIPCLNEEETIGITVADLPRSIDGIDQIEYLIINDGSTDKTEQAAKAAGVHHIVRFTKNKGLASAFMAGIDACIKLGADIIVNTDADNQYFGGDVEKIVKPILEGKADIVIGERPISEIEHFSPLKKILQKVGSWSVRTVSNTTIPDAPSGFRAYKREAALQLNVLTGYTYTIETIIQAGHKKMALTSVPIRTNGMLRESRLLKSMSSYIKMSISTMLRVFIMYKPLKFFLTLSVISFAIAGIIGIRYLILLLIGTPGEHIQSLILSVILAIFGSNTLVMALVSDLIANNRIMLEDVQYRIRKIDAIIEQRKDKNEQA